MTHSAGAVLVAVALSAAAVAPAYGQTSGETTTTPSQTTTTPSQTTTTPAPTTTPTETTPAPESPEPTAAPNEYVESVPTGGGQTPASSAPHTAAPAAPAPAEPATPTQTTTGPEHAAAPPKAKRKRHRQRPSHERRERRHIEAAPKAARPVPTTPVSATAGEPADPLLLGLALLAITVGVLGTAVARRQGAGT